VKGPTSGLSQQADEAEGSLTLEVQGRVGSSPDNDGTDRHHQTVRARQARRRGVTQVNQRLNPLKRGTGSNLVDAGRAAAHVVVEARRRRLRSRKCVAGGEATGNACGVPVARLQGHSWAPIPLTG
jgi:hypothetical protein